MLKYETHIVWSEDDGCFVANAPELPGCYAHGDSPQEALSNLKDAMDLWLDTARECGDPIPHPKSKSVSFDG